MSTGTKDYVLKEYGSWTVLIVSYLTGLIVSRGFAWQAIPLFVSLALLINSKQAYTRWIRGKGNKRALSVLSAHILTAAAILFILFSSSLPMLLPLLVFPAAYLLLNRLAGEHFILTEVLGFALISLAAVLAKFAVTSGLDVRLFIAVMFYFTAGIFKIKTLLRRRTSDRIVTVLYVLFAAYAYHGFHIPVIILLPLLDNLLAAVIMYRVKLQTTGWIEVMKSLLFLALMAAYY